MPRSLWNGTICFGLVNVPVKLLHGDRVQDRALPRGAPRGRREDRAPPVRLGPRTRRCPTRTSSRASRSARTSTSCSRRTRSRRPPATARKSIAIEEFVPVDEIDPVFYAKTYYLGAGEGGEDAYRLLHDALEQTGRAGIGRFTFHDREYLVAVRAARRRARPAHDALRRRGRRPAKTVEFADAGRKGPAEQRDQDGRAARRVARRGLQPRSVQGRVPRARCWR